MRKLSNLILLFTIVFACNSEHPKTTYKGEEVFKTDSGLMYKILEKGKGPKVKTGDVVYTHYTLRLEDGKKIDSSLDRNMPFYLKVGAGEVIKGWDEGLSYMSIGDKRKLIIPPDLGYGARGAGDAVPPNATLFFEVEILNPEEKATYKGEEYIKTPTGLMYKDLKNGKGDTPKNRQTAVVHYTGWLEDGTKFDSSKDRNQPFEVVMPGRVIRGWQEGLKSMKAGGKRKLIIPANLGYGTSGRGSIPPNATLIFDVEMLEIK